MITRLRPARRLAAALALLSAVTSIADAHPAISASALVKVRPDGLVRILLSHDSLAFALDDLPRSVSDEAMFALLASSDESLAGTLDEARARFAESLKCRANGAEIPARIVEFPTVAAVRKWQKDEGARRLPVRLNVVIECRLSPGTRSFAVHFPSILGDVLATFDRPGEEPLAMPVRAGEFSAEVPLSIQSPDAASQPSPKAPAPLQTSWSTVAWDYTRLGFDHILGFKGSYLPEGTDHALFVLGLFLLSPRFKTLLLQITAFTVAHTTTLTLTTFHLVSMPARIIEPTIAASIAFVAIENLFARRVHAWRLAVAFIFGLVHGMGFAAALSDTATGLPTGRLVAGVLAFNVGVECGHVTVLAIAFALLGWCRNKPWYRRRVAIPLSLVIAAIALCWMVQRIAQPA